MKLFKFLPKKILLSARQHIKVGDYIFSGGNFSSKPNAYKNPVGIVIWLNSNPQTAHLCHGGILTTKEILLTYRQASQICVQYNENSKYKICSSLPSVDEWEYIFKHKKQIDSALQKSNNEPITDSYWTSEERINDSNCQVFCTDGMYVNINSDICLKSRIILYF